LQLVPQTPQFLRLAESEVSQPFPEGPIPTSSLQSPKPGWQLVTQFELTQLTSAPATVPQSCSQEPQW
jgi:hypothetical protein